MDGIVAMRIVERREAVTVTVPMSARRMEPPPGRNREPATKGAQCQAGCRIDVVAETLGDGDAGKPDNQCNQQCREYMPSPGLERRARRFGLRPTALPGNERDGHPMVRNNGVQHADDSDGADQQQFRAVIHFPFPWWLRRAAAGFSRRSVHARLDWISAVINVRE